MPANQRVRANRANRATRAGDADRVDTGPRPVDAPLTLTEAAAHLGVHYMTAYRYVRTGVLAAHQRGGQWHVAPEAVQELLATRAAGTARPGRRPAPGGAPTVSSYRPAAAVRRIGALADRLVAGDEHGAWRLVDDAFARGGSHRSVYLDLVAPALVEVGDRWAAGTASVADEHRATGVATRLIGRAGARATRPGRPAGTVVLAAPAGERHGLPTALVADLLRAQGWRAVDLGADTPTDTLIDLARSEDNLVGIALCATTPLTAAARSRLRRSVAQIRRAVPAPVLLGGAAVADGEDAGALGADGWAATADDVLAWVVAR